MTTSRNRRRERELANEVPSGWTGTLPEYLVYRALLQAGKVPGVDFIFQRDVSGGRRELGGLVVDFLFAQPPDLAISVAGVFFHYEQGASIQRHDQIARVQLGNMGYQLITIDDDAALRDASFYVREALQYRDHSRAARGL